MCIRPRGGSHCGCARHYTDVSNEGPMSEVSDVTKNSVIPKPPSDQDKAINIHNIKVICQSSHGACRQLHRPLVVSTAVVLF